MSKLSIAVSTVIVMAAMSFSAQPAAAIEYPWCIQYGGQPGNSCSFVSYDQCMMSARGAGGTCSQNQFYQAQEAKRPQNSRKSKQNN